jgi:alkylhydroperoxidase family enzyme
MKGKSMSRYRIHTEETAPEGSKEALRQLQSEIGLVPNLAGAMAESPAVVGAFTAMRSAYGKSTLTPLERELVLLVAAVELGNSYGVAVHSTVAKGMGASPELLDALRSSLDGSDDRISAIARATRSIAHGKTPTKDELDVLGLVGLSNGQILDLICGVSIGRLVASVFSMAPDTDLDAPFQPQAWSGASAN